MSLNIQVIDYRALGTLVDPYREGLSLFDKQNGQLLLSCGVAVALCLVASLIDYLRPTDPPSQIG